MIEIQDELGKFCFLGIGKNFPVAMLIKKYRKILNLGLTLYQIKVYLLLAILSVSFLIAGDVSSKEKEPAKGLIMPEIVIIKENAGKTFKAIQGDLIHIRLNENPSTGYQWKIDLSDQQVILLEKSEFSPGAQKTIGSGGTRTFQLKAKSSGFVKIFLKLKKEWEPDDSAIDKFEVTIKVEDE
jgi:inhibitor of cysteine peptidase